MRASQPAGGVARATLDAKDRELAALRMQVQQLSRPKMLDPDMQSPPQQDGGPKESDLQKKQK
eukprot:2751967-Pyramimonas_sp.AAC.1